MPRNETYWPPGLLGACPHPGTLRPTAEGKRCNHCNAIIFPPKALALALAVDPAR